MKLDLKIIIILLFAFYLLKRTTEYFVPSTDCLNDNIIKEECKSWCEENKAACVEGTKGYCEKDNNFLTDWCKDKCSLEENKSNCYLINSVKCKEEKHKNDAYCSMYADGFCDIDDNFLQDVCKERCKLSENKEECDERVKTKCDEYKDNPYCSCFKKVNEFTGFENIKEEQNNNTHCYNEDCIKNGYLLSTKSIDDCPDCVKGNHNEKDYTKSKFVETCGNTIFKEEEPEEEPEWYTKDDWASSQYGIIIIVVVILIILFMLGMGGVLYNETNKKKSRRY